MHRGIVSVDEDMLSSADVRTILLHTSFYIAWTVSNLTLACHVVPRALKMRKGQLSVPWMIALAVGGLGLFLHMGSMLMIVMRGKASVELSEIQDTGQRQFLTIHDFTQAAWWGWLPIFYFRFIIPSTEGVSITFRLGHPSADWTHGVHPEKVIAGSLRWIASILVIGCLFYSDWEEDDTTWVAISSVLRAQPYAYFAGPLWLLITVGFAIGVVLSLVQLRLQEETWPRYATVLGSLLFLAMFLSVLIIVEQERFTWIFLVIFMVTLLLWVLRMNVALCHGSRWMPLVYGLGLIILIVASSFWWIFSFPMLVWLCLYENAVPQGAKVCVKVTALQIDDCKEQPEEQHMGMLAV